MIDYFGYVEAVILRGDFVLDEMESKISRLWIEGRLTDDERNELIALAAEHAKDVFQTDVLERLAKVEQDVYELMHPVDIYPVWQKGQTSIKGQVYRADVTNDGEIDLVRYDGGRASTSLSIGKIEGWHLLDRELNVTATITRDAEGGYVITPVNPEPAGPTEEQPTEPIEEPTEPTEAPTE